MAKTKKKKPRVPEVLWRLFRNRARTLTDTILSLIPPNHSRTICRCNHDSFCLACCENRYAFLIRPGDPKAYRRLMSHCFVVVPDAAPRMEGWVPTRRFSQLQMVTRTIEMMLCEMSNSSNVLCNGFDKVSLSSPVVELLSSSAWVILLDRVGDICMNYMLRHTLMFLPDPQNNHFQVSGESIGHLDLKIMKGTSCSPDQNPIHLRHGSCKKRKRNDNADLSLERYLVSFHQTPCFREFISVDLSVTIQLDLIERSLHMDCMKMHRQANSGGEHLPTNREGSSLNKLSTDENLQHHASGGITESKKRTRQFRWQRIQKLRQNNLKGVKDHNLDGRSKPRQVALCGNKKCRQDHHAGAPIRCCCSFLFKAPMTITDRTLIDRQPMFRRVDCSPSLFPKNHILNRLKPCFAGANQLLGEIFGGSFRHENCDWPHDSRICSSDSACLHRSLFKKIKALIRRAHSCEHWELLNKHCPIQTSNTITTQSTDSSTEMAGTLEVGKYLDPHQNGEAIPLHEPLNLGQLHCSKYQVTSFIWAVCRSIIPQELLGGKSNWRTMTRNISIFIGLRRFEKFSLRQCMHKLKSTSFFIFSDINSSSHLIDQRLIRTKGNEGIQMKVGDNKHKMRVKLLECWVYWLFTNLVIPVVQRNFYVTTTEEGKQDVFYYRKSEWDKLTERAISDLKDQTLHHLNVDSVRDIIGKRNFGFSKLRFLPKGNGIRAIANLKACSRIPKQGWFQNKQFFGHHKARPHSRRIKFQYFKSVNYILNDLHVILKDVRCCEPEKLGSSVFDYNDVYKRLCPFLTSLKVSGILPSVYIVVADVVKAFDSINQDKLLSVMRNVIEQDLYCLKKTPEVICTKKSMWLHQNILPEYQTLLRCFSQSRQSVPYRLLHRILVNQESSYHLQNKDLFLSLAEHIKGNVLYLDGEFYLQKNGISQGSILSSLLCSFYFAHLEKNVIYPFLEKACEATNHNTLSVCNAGSTLVGNGETSLPCPKYVLMRFIDDFILITTSRKQATNFFTRLQRGFRDYNCYINSEKYGLNFESDKVSGVSNSRLHAGDNGQAFLPWSGLLINCQTLEIQADYGRYLKNHLCSTLTINWQNKPHRSLEQKLRGFMRPKCHPILFDQNINSEPVVRLNVYQIFLLAAMKFHCYVQGLSRFRKPQPAFSSEVINSFRYLYTLIKRLMRRIFSDSGISPILTLNKEEVEWLGLSAFTRALKRKQSRHRKLLSILRSKLETHPISVNVPSQLKYAIDDMHSSVFWKIKY
ncbi:unnamed protein product [Rhodiola kirilowii]